MVYNISKRNLNQCASQIRKELSATYAETREYLDNLIHSNGGSIALTDEDIENICVYDTPQEVLIAYDIPSDMTYSEALNEYGIEVYKLKSGRIVVRDQDVDPIPNYEDSARRYSNDVSKNLFVNVLSQQ